MICNENKYLTFVQINWKERELCYVMVAINTWNKKAGNKIKIVI